MNQAFSLNESEQIDTVFRALADPIRRDILGILVNGERSAREIAEMLPDAGTTVHYHLQVLRRGGLVVPRAVEPHSIVYRPEWKTLETLASTLSGLSVSRQVSMSP